MSAPAAAGLHWSAAYVGLPWRLKGRDLAGVDCWGLVHLVYRQVVGVAVPSYEEAYLGEAERGEVAALIAGERACWPWLPVAPDAARDFDVAVFRRGRDDSHVGLVVAPGRMLHIVDGALSSLERFDAGRWRRRLIGVWRHAALAGRGA